MVKSFRHYLIVACLSFTANVVILLCFSGFDSIADLDNHSIMRLLFLNGTIALTLFFTEKIRYKTMLGELLGSMATVFLVVFLFGGFVLKLFPFYLWSIPLIAVITLLIFIFVFLTAYLKNQADANSINQKLQENNYE